MEFTDTVAAISTPIGVGGISVIRISGSDSLKIADKIFISKKVPSQMQGYTCAFGQIKGTNGEIIDTCVLTVFRAPHSFTGEDTVEISCHGGMFVTRKVLRACLENGAAIAPRGEFTKRAFLNGKMSLDKAESVMDIISAENNAELCQANAVREGTAAKKIEEYEDELKEILGKLSVWADYPDDDIPEVTPESLKSDLTSLLKKMEVTYKTYDYGQKLKNGIKTVIIGEPNVGKSTFFNFLVGQDRSIVTDIAGTTRDVIEESVNLGDITLRLYDTAGLRKTDDVIEKIGIDYVFKKIDEAELVLIIFDGSSKNTDILQKIEGKIKEKACIAIVNKSDLETKLDVSKIKSVTSDIIFMSAKNKTGMENLENIIKDKFLGGKISMDNGWIANDRQRQCLLNSINCVKDGIEKVIYGETFDIITVILDEALENLYKLQGKKVTDEVVNEVFSKFCVGK